MDGLFFVFLPFLMIVFLSVYAQQKQDCPDCGRPLPLIQSPTEKTWRMWIEGGYLCRNCGCETTLAGEKVASGTGPRTRSQLLGGSILTLTVAVGAVAMFFLLSSNTMAPALLATPPVIADPPLVAPLDAPPVH
jgi:hypothetical protein